VEAPLGHGNVAAQRQNPGSTDQVGLGNRIYGGDGPRQKPVKGRAACHLLQGFFCFFVLNGTSNATLHSPFLVTIKIHDILVFAVKKTSPVGLNVFLKLLTVLQGRVRVMGNAEQG